MSTLKATNLEHANNTGDPNIQLYADGSTSIKSLNNSAENMLMNGGMIIRQRRYTTPANAPTSFGMTNTGYTLDRWRYWKVTGTGQTDVTQDQTNLPPGFCSSYRAEVVTPTQASGFYEIIGQVIEGWHSAALKWGTAEGLPLTVSFWAMTNVPGKYALWLRNNQASNESQIGYVTTYEIPTADTWTHCTVTIPAPPVTAGVSWSTINAIGIDMGWSLAITDTYHGTADTWQTTNPDGTGIMLGTADCVQNWSQTAGNYFRLTGTVANVGAAPKPFVQPNIEAELLTCQRYYYRTPHAAYILGFAYAGSTALLRIIQMRNPVDMRAVPAVSWTTATGWTGTPANDTNNQFTRIYGTGSSTANGSYVQNIECSAEF